MKPKKEFVRKHVFINRPLQLKYMISFLLPMTIMLGFWLFTIFFTTKSIIATNTEIIKEDIENKIAMHLQTTSHPTQKKYESLLDDIVDYLRTFEGNKKSRMQIVTFLLWIFGIGVFLVIIQIVLLTVFFSHRLAGPIYRLEKACNHMIAGDYTEEIHLRKHDEMKRLAGLLNEVNRKTRARLRALYEARDEQAKHREVENLRF
jgi:nitrogen fixation/metabolism regulation signal transduction histidine kinase